MSEHPLTPVEVAEQPWSDPLDGLLSGTYRARARFPRQHEPDHLVVYIRGAGGDPQAEYRGETAVCGIEVDLDPKPHRMGETCWFCLDRVGQAFRDARAAIADSGQSELG